MRWAMLMPGPLPGLNELLAAAKRRARNGWNGYAAIRRRWGRVLVARLRLAAPPRFRRAWVRFTWIEPGRRRDPDNVAAGGRKLLLDAFVQAGVLPDDGWRAIAGWTDRFVVRPGRGAVFVEVLGWAGRCVAGAMLVVALLAGAPPAGAAEPRTSPLNLAPEWPVRLDDAYPAAPRDWQLQTAMRQDWSSEANRFTLRTDLRVGITDMWEVAVGFTPAQAGRLSGDPVDHRAVRAGVLARLTRQAGVWPSQAIRLTIAPPVAGESRAPSLRADWLDSWRLSDRRTWLHFNASYLVAPDPIPGGLIPGRREWWQARIGAVRALTEGGLAVAAAVGVLPSPFELGDRLRADPEIGLIVPVGGGWVLQASAGVLVGQDNVMRAQVGLGWTF